MKMKKIHKATYTTARSAFTLAELLVGILVVSVILTLLAPVITKRAKESISINGGGAGAGTVKSKLFIYNESDPDCTQAAGSTNVLDCTFTAPQGVNRVNAVAVSAGGGGAGATQPTIETGKRLTVANTTVGSSRTQEITITNNMKNILISQLIGSGAGGGGATWAETASSSAEGGSDFRPSSQSECDKYNAIYLAPQYNAGSGICVSRYNVGDSNGPSIASGTSKLSVNQTCSGRNCCWSGNTSSSCNSNNSTYSGCRRTVCTWSAAEAACNSWKINGSYGWRLPTNDELDAWSDNFNSIRGLRLCDEHTGNSSPACRGAERCPSSAGGSYCWPQLVWSGTVDNKWSFIGNRYSVYLLDDSLLGVSLRSYDYEGSSARCVLGPVPGSETSVTLSGGGGSAGAYIKNYQIPNSVISSNIGGKIVLYSAAGGAGGSSASSSGSSASNGSNGNTSYIEVYSSDNVLKWGIRASGGYAGEGASSSNYGEGGAERTIASCQLYENGSWRSVNCTGIGAKGLDGTKAENASSTNTATGGTGGGSMYNTTVAQGGGVGGSTSGANGYSGSVYGAGGGGATITFNSSNNAVRGTGGRGANGVAEITYDVVYQGAAGGGGGGGAYVELSDISVSSGNTYTIKVGNGGSGGSISTKGSDGGESEIVFDSITYTLSGGKGGQIGTSATSTTSVIQGIGGSGGIVSSNVSDTTNIKYKNGSKGEDGGSFTKDDTHSNSTNYGGSYGGVGGVSGIDTKGSCSGLFIDSSICSNTTVNGITNTFVAPIINNTAIDYGQAGAGGGGGGWSENTILYPNPGSGSQGQGGYVFIYWRE